MNYVHKKARKYARIDQSIGSEVIYSKMKKQNIGRKQG